MSSASAPSVGPPRRITRPGSGRVLVGVCAGIAEHLSTSVRVVRWVFVGLSLAGGAGVAAYLLLWVLTPSSDGAPLTGDVQDAHRRAAGVPRSVRLLLVGVLLLGAGAAAALGGGDEVQVTVSFLFPLLAVVGGAVLAWSNLDDAARRSWLGGRQGEARRGLVRIGVGVLLAASGIVVVATRGRGLDQMWDVAVATLVVLAGLSIVLAPWGLRWWGRLQEEQASRAREQERADIAAHLHDSVLQTLALIQRTDDVSRAGQLARRQERELRSWLYGSRRTEQDTLRAAVISAVHEVEDLHVVPVDLVVIGDRPLDDPGLALVAAVREAVLNAVRHGAPPVSSYVEVGPHQVEAFVRDHGAGFDLDTVPQDRLGVRESILGRMARHGGSAQVRRLDSGTEVGIRLPVPGPVPAPIAGRSQSPGGEGTNGRHGHAV